MTKQDAALHPGEYFIERRDKPSGQWEFYCRDSDLDVMRTRFAYWKENGCPGQGVRLFAPDCSLVDEFIWPTLVAVDKPAPVGEIKA
jgi:hypothetical protein